MVDASETFTVNLSRGITYVERVTYRGALPQESEEIEVVDLKGATVRAIVTLIRNAHEPAEIDATEISMSEPGDGHMPAHDLT